MTGGMRVVVGGAVLAAVLVVGGGAATAQVAVSARISESARLGDRFRVVVTVVHGEDVPVDLASTLDLGPAFREDRRARRQRVIGRAAGQLTREIDLVLRAYDVGELVVPSLPLYQSGMPGEKAGETGPLAIKVEGVAGAADDTLRDVAAPVSVWRRDMVMLYGVAGAAGLALVVGLVWRLRVAARPRPARARVAAAAPPLAPDEEALRRLAAVESGGLLDAVDRGPAFVALSEIMRSYLGRRYELRALDLTTAEIAAALASRANQDTTREISDWLRECDLVKFASFRASAKEARGALVRARLLVRRTAAPAAAGEERAVA
jgi:hypothetical protein